jgi:hypothetical protein
VVVVQVAAERNQKTEGAKLATARTWPIPVCRATTGRLQFSQHQHSRQHHDSLPTNSRHARELEHPITLHGIVITMVDTLPPTKVQGKPSAGAFCVYGKKYDCVALTVDFHRHNVGLEATTLVLS